MISAVLFLVSFVGASAFYVESSPIVAGLHSVVEAVNLAAQDKPPFVVQAGIRQVERNDIEAVFSKENRLAKIEGMKSLCPGPYRPERDSANITVVSFRQRDRVDFNINGRASAFVFNLRPQYAPIASEIDIPKMQQWPQLVRNGFLGDSVGLVGKPQGYQNKNTTGPANVGSSRCPPSAISGCVRRFPLGAQIGISLIFAGAAILCVILGAMRPFSLFVIGRSDIAKAIGYGFMGSSLFVVSFWIWMLGG